MMRFLLYAALWLEAFPGVAQATKRDWKHDLAMDVTRCFDARDVSVKCEDFSNSEERVVRQDLQISAINYLGKKFYYTYGQAVEGSTCGEDLARIRKLLRKVDQACVTGMQEFIVENGETEAKWFSFETKRGELSRQ